MLDTAAITALLQELPNMPLEEKAALLEELDRLEAQRELDACRDDFLAFCKKVYPNWKEGPHHRHLKPKLHAIAEGIKTRMSVSMPPRFGKSETIAYLFVAWYLGKHPTHHIMMVTHTAALSADFGRKVRNLIDSDVYQKIFPDTKVSKDKSAADNWTTTLGGKYLAIGIGANVAGHGAHLLVADDLVSEQAVLNGNPDNAFSTAWEYMQVGPLQRLMPGGRIVMIGCMTAETRVLMADGSEKELQNIVVGDEIATYDNGVITTSFVTNWIKHRDDTVYKIKTSSGKIVRANKRHPFLVDRAGVRTWVRVRDLQVGDRLVETAPDLPKPKDCAQSVTSASCTLKDVSARNVATGIGGSGEASSAKLKAAGNRSAATVSATAATAKRTGVLASAGLRLSKNVKDIFAIATGFLHKLMTLCCLRREDAALSAKTPQQRKTQEQEKYQNCTLITATTLNTFAGCSATTATWPSGMQKPSPHCLPQPHTYKVTTAPIIEIIEDGFEPVFDMEVARTENFIANGVVSHNTRWGKKDPIGRALEWALNNPGSPQWDEVKFPAIMDVSRDGVNKQVSLWPEQWPVEQLLAKKASMFPQFWAAQYMQAPTSEEGAIIKREWWRTWEREDPPTCEYVMISIDTAYETKNSSDYTAFATWGVWTTEALNYKPQLILLDAWKDRIEFPELKRLTLKHYKEWSPDTVIVEKKAAGAPLIQELRQMGVPVQEFTPTRGNDKRVRLNAVTDLFASGIVWAPATRWAKEVIDEVAEFPNGEHDDYVDVTSQALLRFRQGGFVSLDSDEDGEPIVHRRRQHAYY